ncbi:MAG: helix-turn-helix domain-containing protein [Actinomycetota bacterium]|nr:helix-turn-helix domain-containing protein [Actinomycetota bacterium]
MYGTFVRAVREARSLTQKQLAETSGVRQENISAIESGRRVPSADTLNRLLVACGFELTATAGARAIYCPLPHQGWFPDEDLPARSSSDPPDEQPVLAPAASMQERVRVITAVLEAVDATMGP